MDNRKESKWIKVFNENPIQPDESQAKYFVRLAEEHEVSLGTLRRAYHVQVVEKRRNRDIEQYQTEEITTDKAELGEFNWRDAIKPLQTFQKMFKAHKGSQDYANWEVRTKKPICVLVLGDAHMGSWATDYDKLIAITDEIINTPNLYVVLVGDLLQMSIKLRGVLEVSDNALPPYWQIRFLESWLMSVKHKVICSTWDNHCYSEDTEVLSNNGWKLFNELDEEDLVAQFDADGQISFAKPTGYFADYYTGDMYEIEGFKHNQFVTPNHKVVLQGQEMFASEFAEKKELHGTNNLFLTGSGYIDDAAGHNWNDDYLRLLTWTVMDGTTLVNRKGSNGMRVQFKLSKQRKIDELKAVLDRLDIPYTFKVTTKSGCNVLQPYVFRIYSKYANEICEHVGLGKDKKFPSWFASMPKRQLDIVLDTIAKTDGRYNSETSIYWSSSTKWDIDIIQRACLYNGYSLSFREQTFRTGFKKTRPNYACMINLTHDRNMPIKVEKKQYDGMIYCVEMPLGTVITRRNGKTCFSGNSVMREENAVGFSTYAEIFKRHTIYHSGIGHIDVKVGKEIYKLAVAHFFRGRTMLNPCHSLMRYMRMEANDREVCAAGDSHVAGLIKYMEGGTMRVALNCGSLQNSGYGKRLFSLKNQNYFPCFTLDPNKHEITPYWSVSEWLKK